MTSDSLHVTGLPEGLDEGMVTQFFSIYGTVASCKISNPAPDGKTISIVTFANSGEAKSIMEQLNNNVPAGLTEPLSIKYALAGGTPSGGAAGSFGKWTSGGAPARASPWTSNSSGEGGAVRGGDGEMWAEPKQSDNVYVQGLPAGTSQESAMSTFAEFGKVVSIKLLEKPGMPVAALIRFDGQEAAKLVKEILNGAQPEGFPGPLKVRYANQQKGSLVGAGGCRGKGQSSWQQGSWGGDASWGAGAGKGKGGKGGGIDADTLVNLVIESGYLPGGQSYGSAVDVDGLPMDADQHQVYRMFAPYGAIQNCIVKPSHDSAWGTVSFIEKAAAEAAVTAYNGMEMPNGRTLKANIQARQGGGY